MKRVLQLLMAALLSVLPLTGYAQTTLIVADGLSTSQYVPVHGFYCETSQRTQSLYPASMLSGMTGSHITALHYYVSSGSSANWSNATFMVKLGETTQSSLASSWASSTSFTTVYTGTLTASESGGMDVVFNTPYTYNGGNLVIQFQLDAGTGYTPCNFYGISQTGASRHAHGSGYLTENGSAESILPKVQFTYTSGGGGGGGTPSQPCVSSIPYVENFESYPSESSHSAGALSVFSASIPSCWTCNHSYYTYESTVVSTGETHTYSMYSIAHVVAGATNRFHSGTKSMAFHTVLWQPLFAVLPAMATPLNQLQLSFWMGTFDATQGGNLTVGYLTSDDLSSFIPIHTFRPSDATATTLNYSTGACSGGATYVVDLSRVASNATRLAFRWEDYCKNAGCGNPCFIDDITLTLPTGNTATCTYSIPYTEGFEGTTPISGTTATSLMVQPIPECWDVTVTHQVNPNNVEDTFRYVAHAMTSSSHVGTTGNSCLAMITADYSENYALFPHIEGDLTDAELSFWMGTNSESGATLTVGYVTDGDAGTFTALQSYPNSNSTLAHGQTVTLSLADLPAEAYRLAFKWEASSSLYTHKICYIDDIKVAPPVDCGITLPYSYGFEDANVFASCWTVIDQGEGVNTPEIRAEAAQSGSAGFRFSSYALASSYDQYLITPQFYAPNGVTVQFAYKRPNAMSEIFRVGYSTTNATPSSFTWGDQISAGATWNTYSAEFPAGTKYVAIHYYTDYAYYLYIDNFSLTSVPCPDPPTQQVEVMNACGGFTWNGVYFTASGSYTHTTQDAGGCDVVQVLQLTVNPENYTFESNVCATGGFPWQGSTLTADADLTHDVIDDNGCDATEIIHLTVNPACCPAPTGFTTYEPTGENALEDGVMGFQWDFVEGNVYSLLYVEVGTQDSVLVGTDITYGTVYVAGLDPSTQYLFRLRSYCSQYATSPYADLTFTTHPLCHRVEEVTVTDVTQTTISIAWTDYFNSVATYEVRRDGTVIATGLTATNYTATGLNPGTEYTFSVHTRCGDYLVPDYALTWDRTLCDPVAVPLSEGFENNTVYIPICWRNLGDHTWDVGSGDYSSYPGSHSGSWNLKSSNATGETAMIASPLFNLSSLDNPTLTFWYINRASNGNCDELRIHYRTSPTASWQQLMAITAAHGSWTGATLLLPSDAVQVAFESVGHGGLHIGLDDIAIENGACLPVTDLTATATVSSVTLAWSAPAVGGVTYSLAQDGTVLATDLTATGYTVTGLVPGTEYTFSVTAHCSPTVSSVPVTVSVTTPCGIASLPYTQDFENGTAESLSQPLASTDFIDCMKRLNSENITNPSLLMDVLAHSGTKSLYFQGNTSHGSGVLVLPELNTALHPFSGLQLRFWSLKYTVGDFEVGVMTNPADATTFTTVATAMPTGNSQDYWDEMVVSLASYSGTGHYVAIRTVGGFLARIDDLTLEEVSCHVVNDLVVATIANTSVTLQWANSGNSGASYSVTWTDGTETYAAPSPISATSYTATDLTPNTLYTFHVRTNCSATEMSLPVSVNVTTSCIITTLPWTQDFENGMGCMKRNVPNIFITQDFTSHSSDHDFKWTRADNDKLLVLPEVNTTRYPINTLRVRFWSDKIDADWYTVGVMTDPDDPATFTPVMRAEGTGEMDSRQYTYLGGYVKSTDWYEVAAGLSTYTGTGSYVAIRVPGGYYGQHFIDDLVLEEGDFSCAAISSLPWTLDFEGTWSCTRRHRSTDNVGEIYIDEYVTSRSGNHLLNWNYAGYPSQYRYLVLPEVNTALYPIDGLRVRLWIDNNYANNFSVGVMTDPDDPATFTPVDNAVYTGNSSNVYYGPLGNHVKTWYEMTAELGAYTGTGSYVAIRGTRGPSEFFDWMDDIVIEERCGSVVNLRVDDATENSVTLRWETTGDVATYTVIKDGIYVTGNHAADSYTVTGLTRGNHTFTIIPNCPATTQSSSATLYLTLAKACDKYRWNGHLYTSSGIYRRDGATLALTIKESEQEDFFATECSGYSWYEHTNLTTSQTVSHTFAEAAANGCDLVQRMHLTIRPCTTLEMTACDSYQWHGKNLTSSGTYEEEGETLILTILHSEHQDLVVEATDSYSWYEHTNMTTSQTVSHTFVGAAANGCDLIQTLHLSITGPSGIKSAGCDTVEVCGSYTWHGFTFTSSGHYTLGGDTLQLTVHRIATGDTLAKSCGSYLWYGEWRAESGAYSHTLSNAGTCDSIVTLHLDVMACTHTVATACDSYLWKGFPVESSGTYIAGYDTLSLTLFRSTTADTVAEVCDGASWSGEWRAESGEYSHTTVNAAGCDSTVTLHLTVYHGGSSNQSLTVCDFYPWKGQILDASGTYTADGADLHGCVSHDTLQLTVLPGAVAVEEVTACNSYLWHGTEYQFSTTYPVYATMAANGCDSIVTLHLTIDTCSVTEITSCGSYLWRGQVLDTGGLYIDGTDTLLLTVRQPSASELEATACDSYFWDGAWRVESGAYSRTATNAVGCDSTVTLHLTVNHSTASDLFDTVCNSVSWHGNSYTASGDYTYALVNAANCDSTVTLHLTVNHSTTVEETVTACNSYLWSDSLYTASGDYTYVSAGADGCDHTTTLHLTVNHSTAADTFATACDNYTWNGGLIAESGAYSHTTVNAVGCDSTVTLHLTVNHSSSTNEDISIDDSLFWNGTWLAESGVYLYTTTNAEGCDSTVTLHLTVTHPLPAPFTLVIAVNDVAMGTTDPVPGSYTLQVGEETTVTAVARPGYHFLRWTESGTALDVADTFYTVTVTPAMAGTTYSLVAHFAATQGIDEVDHTDAVVYVDQSAICVDRCQGATVTLFDLFGRMLYRRAGDSAASLRFEAPASGVYFVKVGAAPARRVVVMR